MTASSHLNVKILENIRLYKHPKCEYTTGSTQAIPELFNEYVEKLKVCGFNYLMKM